MVVFIETPRVMEKRQDGNLHSSHATSGKGTTVTTENGTLIPEVKSVDIHIAFDKAITADINLHASFRGHANATFYTTDPSSGRDKAVQKIVFVDGSEWSAS